MNRMRSRQNAFLRFCALAAIPATAQGIWSVQRPLPTNNSLYAIKAIDKDRVLACGTLGQIFRTMDGGATWKEAASGTAYGLRGLSVGAGVRSHLFAVGDSGTILSTIDGGLTWKPQASGTKAALNAVSAVDAKTAYACGASGSLLKTSDGNATWKGHFLGPIEGMGVNGSGLYGVFTVNRDTVFVSALDAHRQHGGNHLRHTVRQRKDRVRFRLRGHACHPGRRGDLDQALLPQGERRLCAIQRRRLRRRRPTRLRIGEMNRVDPGPGVGGLRFCPGGAAIGGAHYPTATTHGQPSFSA